VNALRERDMLADVWVLSKVHKEDRLTIHALDELVCRLRSANGPTALLTDSNLSALMLMNELSRRGLRVPEDISVCAVASDSNTVAGHRLTCCRFDFLGMGRKAVGLLAKRCQKPVLRKPCVHRIGFEFVEGQTVRSLSKT
jgi:DNA-binding LacI/PurR family transcriptional regulator